ncbi:FAD/NAD(P)-binding protein [Asaia bogorensis]|uniref:FAD/NAD(P)-binding protein n=1 Tax=Asaia bogorensis TaxID=91915 RepID=UPI000EFB8553|nr:FAD/NAD(P)-binding protein [Asaia bogorensis]
MDRPYEIVIIGGGASATLLAHVLKRQHGRNCLIIDPNANPALGVAYGTRCIGHLLNVPACGMSGLADEPDHFVQWLHRHIDPGIAPDAFIPRAIYGLYLQHLFDESGVISMQGKVVACDAVAWGFRLVLASGEIVMAQQVVLALGNFPPAMLRGATPEVMHDPRYHQNVWDSGAGYRTAAAEDMAATGRLTPFAPEATLLMIGSGLTAIDIVMKARLASHAGPIHLLSGHASLPKSHKPGQRSVAPVISVEKGADQKGARLSRYVREFHAALRQGLDWRSAIDSLRPITNILWATLSQTEQARFNRHLRRRWDVARHRIAPQIAAFLHDALQEGTLELHAGRVTHIEAQPEGLIVTASHAGGQTRFRADHVLNCTGPDLDYTRVGSALLEQLFASGLASPGNRGAGLDTGNDGRLINANGESPHALYTLGPARLGTLFESIAIPEIRQQAYDLATRLASPSAVQTSKGASASPRHESRS